MSDFCGIISSSPSQTISSGSVVALCSDLASLTSVHSYFPSELISEYCDGLVSFLTSGGSPSIAQP